MKRIDVIYNPYGYIDEVSDNSIHFEQENESLQINATIETKKKVRAYIKAPNNNSTVTDELTPVGGVYSCTVEGAYMAKGTLYVGYELYDDTGYIERLEPLKIYIDSFVSLGAGSSDNVYVVTVTVGNVETVPYEEKASVENTGTKKDMILNFKIPRGERGLKGEKGDKGDKGEQGLQGERGEPFVYEDFTAEQLEALKGPKGDKGDRGEQGIQGIQGIQGVQGNDGYTPIKGVDYFTEEDIKSLGIDEKADLSYVEESNRDIVSFIDESIVYVESQLENKVDKADGKGLSSNDFTNELNLINNNVFNDNDLFDGTVKLDYDFNPETYIGILDKVPSNSICKILDKNSNFIGIIEDIRTGGAEELFYERQWFEDLNGNTWYCYWDENAEVEPPGTNSWTKVDYTIKLKNKIFNGDMSNCVTKEQLDEAIGDIETALDSIIEMQNSLIGGDA